VSSLSCDEYLLAVTLQAHVYGQELCIALYRASFSAPIGSAAFDLFAAEFFDASAAATTAEPAGALDFGWGWAQAGAVSMERARERPSLMKVRQH
jgi:hypothetical protein